jgi:hypothetical protein
LPRSSDHAIFAQRPVMVGSLPAMTAIPPPSQPDNRV